MNPCVTSKEAILQVCRSIVATKGLSALNMRTVADECHIALGTLYGYYSNKDDLLLSTIESVWKDIFHMSQKCETDFSFSEYVSHIFICVQQGSDKYADFFTAHSVSIANSEKGRGRDIMKHYFHHMKSGMLKVLATDSKVRKDAFSSTFTESDFIDFVLDNILLLLVRQRTSCTALMEVICRVIYE